MFELRPEYCVQSGGANDADRGNFVPQPLIFIHLLLYSSCVRRKIGRSWLVAQVLADLGWDKKGDITNKTKR